MVEAKPITTDQLQAGERRTRVWHPLALFGLILFLVIHWNGNFKEWSALEPARLGNDVQAIISGYRTTPNLITDGLRWRHGPWIEEGIQVYRPISSYLL